MDENRPSETADKSPNLGSRLRELRKAAGLTQSELAQRMGRGNRSYKTRICRLEKGSIAQPTMALLADYLKACGATFADVADLVGVGIVPAASAQPATPKRVRVRREPTLAEKVNRVQQAADRAAFSELVEGTLLDFLKEQADMQRVEPMKKLCDFGRLAFGAELRRHRIIKARRDKLLADPTLKPEQVSALEALMLETARIVREAGSFDRHLPVDAVAVLSGKARIRPPKKAEKLLLAEQREAFDRWSRMRYWTIQRMRTEYVQQLQAEGIENSKIGPLADFVVSLGAMLSDTEGNPPARDKQSADLLATMGDKDAANKALAFCVERWRELGPQIPKKP